jgi:hypothetical protein
MKKNIKVKHSVHQNLSINTEKGNSYEANISKHKEEKLRTPLCFHQIIPYMYAQNWRQKHSVPHKQAQITTYEKHIHTLFQNQHILCKQEQNLIQIQQ